ncbi:MAG: ABC transporter permease, partial [Saprospiraceae bacterium]
LDKQFAQLYSADKNFSKMLLFFTFLAILIACLGLFGLASYIAHLRTKEIGVRKVLGSSIPQIVRLLSVDFLKLVFVAVLLASPIAWYCSREWLNNYEYRIAIEGSVFLWAGIIALSIAFLTIGAQSLKAALANPVNSLRND